MNPVQSGLLSRLIGTLVLIGVGLQSWQHRTEGGLRWVGQNSRLALL